MLRKFKFKNDPNNKVYYIYKIRRSYGGLQVIDYSSIPENAVALGLAFARDIVIIEE